jgi:hypothetical protein
MVYEWLRDEEAREKYADQLIDAVYYAKSCGHTPCDCEFSLDTNLPHFLQPTYMGQTTARKLMETMCKGLNETLCVKGLEKIKDVIFHDIFISGPTICVPFVACKSTVHSMGIELHVCATRKLANAGTHL